MTALLALLMIADSTPPADPVATFGAACLAGHFAVPDGASAPAASLPAEAGALLASLTMIPDKRASDTFATGTDAYLVLQAADPAASPGLPPTCTVIWRGADKTTAFAVIPPYEAGVSMQKAARDGWIALRAIPSTPVAAP